MAAKPKQRVNGVKYPISAFRPSRAMDERINALCGRGMTKTQIIMESLAKHLPALEARYNVNQTTSRK